MNKFLYFFIAVVGLSLFTGCSFDDAIDPPNYVTFERDRVANVGVDLGGSTTHEVTVYTGNITSNDRTFELLVSGNSTLDPAGYNVPATVTVPGGTNEGTFTVELLDFDLGLTGRSLILNLGETSELAAGKPYQMNVTQTCVGREFVITFEFDGYASEMDYTIADADGNVIVTGGGYADGTVGATRSLCLEQGTYTFTVTDAYGDGLTWPNVGSITLSYAGEVLVVIPGDYGEGTSVEVTF